MGIFKNAESVFNELEQKEFTFHQKTTDKLMI